FFTAVYTNLITNFTCAASASKIEISRRIGTMHTPPIFADLLIILLVSVPVAFLCLRLKLPLLVGLMLTGISIGPYGLGLVKEVEGIEMLAEIGVMLLLFTIGLEFSLHRLREMKRLVLIGGGLQVVLTIAVVAGAAVFWGRGTGQAIFFGFLAAMSSTAIVLKTYVERNEVDSPHGRAGVGILLFQDISIVFMMLAIPLLGGGDVVSFTSILLNLGGSIIALILIVLAAWLLIPKFLNRVVMLKSPEVLLLTVVLLCLGMSWVTSQFGLSLALGAFIAGMVLADSDYSHQVTSEILPFRDVFNSVFFVSIGMLLSLAVLWANLGTVLILVLCLLAGKTLIIWAIIRLLGSPQRVAVITGLGLAQIGEFSFILAKTGRGAGLLPNGDYQSFLAASIISMIATPFLIAAAPRIGYFIQSILSDGKSLEIDNTEAEDIHLTSSGGLNQHVIIVGYGLNGRNLARVLRSVGVPYVILELNAEVVRRAKGRGEKINFGDSTRREVLQHAEVENAWALVLAMSDPQAARRTVTQARHMSENLHIIVRTRYVTEITELLGIGANEVIPEEFETSIEIFSRVLHRYGIARNVIESQIERVRRQGYEMLRSTSPVTEKLDGINVALDAASTETIKIEAGSPVAGRNLGELDLRGKTGATVIAILRNGQTKISPGANYKLNEADTIVLLGPTEKIEQAVKILKPESELEIGGFNA
ncbi:MAG: cation:proton antiporter, partial [Acidobacteriota bacterium]|nr:cation:proton antiporter [Acidobacteriota bacterium]